MSYDSWKTSNPADDYTEKVMSLDVECFGDECEYTASEKFDVYVDRYGISFFWDCPKCGHHNEEEREQEDDRY